MGLHLENEVAVVKTPTIISNNPVFRETESSVVLSSDEKVERLAAQSVTAYLYSASHTA